MKIVRTGRDKRLLGSDTPSKGTGGEGFSQFLSKIAERRDAILRALAGAGELLELVKEAPEKLYRIELPTEIADGIAKGDLRWGVRPDGSMPAVVRHAENSGIAKHVSLRCYQRPLGVPLPPTSPTTRGPVGDY